MPSPISTPAPRLSPIYVVDDDPAILHSTRFLFECEGHRVETFASGPELLSAFPGPCPLCVLLDQVMPGMDGLEVCRRLRLLDAAVPVILITGHPDPRIRARARDAGVPLIDKPLAFEAFVGLLAAGRIAPDPHGHA
ncbi:response regulator transcription factor [Methylobacterium sp. SyP6R]|uniref:response regulator transcription factor n=1 Tax=Methylobacterium sp. SyP6R TaxID=2718876 RepID=UPI001F013560|nr:response regulator [Methylobacterium sp. SyP6R]MCF4129879.1 response regulator [Methylobacterium sp. SyP6R]